MSVEDFVIPSQIPWERLKGSELEECLYWLIDSMGGKDLEWRVGGKGSGTADQGRDLECSFYMSNPEGDLSRENWWIEAKGRTSTVEPSEVKEAVLNAAGRNEIDVLVIATNTQFSNPTRDWLREWQHNHPRPRVRLWEKATLERLCSKHPAVAARLFSEALSTQGRLELARSRLWNYSLLTDEPTLRQLWEDRESLTWAPESLLAVIVSDCGTGNICARPWATVMTAEDLLLVLATGLLNFLYLVFRADAAGTRQRPFIQALSYITLAALDRLDSDSVVKFLETMWEKLGGRAYPCDVRELILKPVLGTLVREIEDVCVSDCSRVSRDLVGLKSEDIDQYWDRLLEPGPEEKDEKPRPILHIEAHAEPCKVGFVVDKKRPCPICRLDEPEKDLSGAMTVLKKIVRARKPNSRAGH